MHAESGAVSSPKKHSPIAEGPDDGCRRGRESEIESRDSTYCARRGDQTSYRDRRQGVLFNGCYQHQPFRPWIAPRPTSSFVAKVFGAELMAIRRLRVPLAATLRRR